VSPGTESGMRSEHQLPATASPLAGIEVADCHREGADLTMTVRVAVSGDDPHLRGHFPGLPILPGVFVVEALCQAVAAGLAPAAGRPPELAAVRSVRLLAPLLAGDELTLAIAGSARPGGGWTVTATGFRADGTTAARVRADFDCDAAGPADA